MLRPSDRHHARRDRYLAPELVNSVEAQALLVATLTALVQTVPTNEYVLLIGAYGLNFLLDVALRLKTDIDGEALRAPSTTEG